MVTGVRKLAKKQILKDMGYQQNYEEGCQVLLTTHTIP